MVLDNLIAVDDTGPRWHNAKLVSLYVTMPFEAFVTRIEVSYQETKEMIYGIAISSV